MCTLNLKYGLVLGTQIVKYGKFLFKLLVPHLYKPLIQIITRNY